MGQRNMPELHPLNDIFKAMEGHIECECPICAAIQEIVKASETCIKQIQYGFGPDLPALERAVIKYWQTSRQYTNPIKEG